MAEKKKTVNEVELIQRAKKNFKFDFDACKETYDEMIDDLYFGQGINQWPDSVRVARENDKRPCLRINKMPQFVDRVLGDLRQSRPTIKARPFDDRADKDTAEIIGGIIRNIEQQSDAEIVYDSGAEAMVRCGYGAWRVLTDYVSDESFDQEILIDRIKNQFSVVFDANAKKWDKSDSRRAYVYEDMPRDVFKQRWPKKDPCDFSAGGKDQGDWIREDTVRVMEYFERDITSHKLYLILPNGQQDTKTVTELPADYQYAIIKERTVQDSTITWYRISGKEILEGPIELKGQYIPLIPCYGKETNIEGKSYYNGVIRHAKDSQRLYNYFRSYDAETIALAPKAPWIMTAKMLGDYTTQWKQANERNFSYLLYDPDPNAPGGKPERNIPQMTNQAIIQQVMIADQELHDTTGLQLASLGKKSNEQSGAAIQARAKEGDIGQFTYIDNVMRAIKHTAKIIVDLIPYIYDTARVQRIIGEDGESKTVKINAQFEDDKTKESRIFDMTMGKYDVIASVGPSYQTQRQEALAAMIDFAKILDNQQRAIISDQIAATSDWHGADRIAKRLKRTIPPNLLGPEDAEEDPQPPAPPNEQEIKMQAMADAKMEVEQETAEVELDIKKAKLDEQKAKAAIAEAEAAIKEAEATNVARGFQRPDNSSARATA
jgi:hypothetical protein